VRLGVVEKRADGMEESIRTLVQDHARTTAALDHVNQRLTDLAQDVAKVPDRIEDKLDQSEERLSARLSSQDEALGEVRADAGRAAAAAEAARDVAEDAREDARRQWPTVAKAVVTVLGGIIIGVSVYFLTHL
jgi:ABC-type transporter Mla subunit MlaD